MYPCTGAGSFGCVVLAQNRAGKNTAVKVKREAPSIHYSACKNGKCHVVALEARRYQQVCGGRDPESLQIETSTCHPVQGDPPYRFISCALDVSDGSAWSMWHAGGLLDDRAHLYCHGVCNRRQPFPLRSEAGDAECETLASIQIRHQYIAT